MRLFKSILLPTLVGVNTHAEALQATASEEIAQGP